MQKLLIFDLDGTLADTLYTIRDAVNMCLYEFGLPTRSYDEVRAAVGNGTRVLMEKSVPCEVLHDRERFEEIFARFGECYAETYDRIDGCYDGLYDAIIALHARGFKLAVLSNKPDEFVKGIVKKLFPDGVFALSLGQTQLPKKPDPTVPHMICKELYALPADTYFIGDSEVDVATAKNAGFHSVAVSWGFRERAQLEAVEPEVIIDTPDELLTFFKDL